MHHNTAINITNTLRVSSLLEKSKFCSRYQSWAVGTRENCCVTQLDTKSGASMSATAFYTKRRHFLFSAFLFWHRLHLKRRGFFFLDPLFPHKSRFFFFFRFVVPLENQTASKLEKHFPPLPSSNICRGV